MNHHISKQTKWIWVISLVATLLIALFAVPNTSSKTKRQQDYVALADSNQYTTSSASEEASFVIAAYYPEWAVYDRDYHIKDIPTELLTHIFYAFANVSPTGEVIIFDPYAATEKAYPGDQWDEPIRGNFKQIKLMKQKNSHLKVLISVGGWTLSGKFSDIALSPESRRTFALSAINFIKKYGFDGIDIDWEYPVGGGLETNMNRPGDGENYVLLLKELREHLNSLGKQTGKHYLLTIASAAGDHMKNFILESMSEYVDWFNVMTYDYHGNWENVTNHLAPLYVNPSSLSDTTERFNVDYTIKYYLEQGVPSQKIVMGIPLYSRGWSGVGPENNGLFQLTTGIPYGSWESGIMDYWDIFKKVKNEPSQYKVFSDEAARASWVYNPKNQTFWTFENVPTVKLKLSYALENNLRGVMFWDVSGDIRDKESPDSILRTVYDEVLQVKNLDKSETMSGSGGSSKGSISLKNNFRNF